MMPFAGLVLKVAVATVAGLSMIAAAEALSSPYNKSPQLLVTNSHPIWSTYPVRVDRTKQLIERPPDFYPFKFRGSRDIRALDNATFTMHGDTYLLQGVSRLEAKAICRSDDERLRACGSLAKAELRRVLQQGYLECHRRRAARNVYLVNCHSGGRLLSELLKYTASAGLATDIR